eukprot:747064-Hanusia_phi.AAC.1
MVEPGAGLELEGLLAQISSHGCFWSVEEKGAEVKKEECQFLSTPPSSQPLSSCFLEDLHLLSGPASGGFCTSHLISV